MANLTDIYKKASLVMKPAAMKDGKLYSQQPHSGAGDFTFSRANGVQTRINEHGLIEDVADNTPRLSYDLVTKEEARTNQVTHSENFTNTSYWGNVIDVVSSLGQEVDPEDTITANKIQANSGLNYKILRTNAFTIPSGITMSMFVKRGNHDYITFKAQGDYSFNLSTLEWRFDYGDNVGYELYPDGWVRLYATTTSSSTSYFGIYLVDGSFNQYWNATGGEFVYVWGAQYEKSTQMTDYIPTSGSTVTVPAVVVASECPTLLLEPTETNLINYSSDFTNWGDTGVTVTSDDTVAPDGSQTADKIESTGNNWRRNKIVTGILSGVDHTFSVFVKMDEDSPYSNNYIAQLEFYKGASGVVCRFDLINKTFLSNTGLSDPFIESYPNGWFRIGGTYTADGTTNYAYVYPSQQYGVAGSMYFWGAQLEASSYPTSYIPTEGSTEARNQDDFESSFTGLTSSAATIFLDFETKGLDSNFRRLFAVNDSVTSEGIYLGMYSTNTIGFFGIDGGGGLPDIKDTISFNQRNKLVLTFDGNGNYKYSLNGSLKTGTYVGTSRKYDEVGRGNVIGGASNNIQIHEITVFDEVISDSELITLTT